MGLAAFNRMRREQAEREAKAQQEQGNTEKPINKLNVAELKEKLTTLNIEFDESTKKADLIALLKGVNKEPERDDQEDENKGGGDQEDQNQEENQPE